MSVLGLKGDGDWSADERPTNYRQWILFLNPNGKTPLTGFMSKLKQEVTDDPEFNIFQKGLPPQMLEVEGAQTDVDATIELKAGANQNKWVKPGDVLMNERTLEIVWVTASSVADTLTVSRNKGGGAAAAMNDGDILLVIGSHYEEGASVPTAVAHSPDVVTNYTQIFRNSLFLTRTATKTRLRTGDALKEAKRECLEMHAIGMEKAFLFGDAVSTTGSLGQPDRTTMGVLNFLSTNTQDFSGGTDINTWETFMADIFKYGSTEKVFLCGNTALKVLNAMGRAHYHVEVTPSDQTYGVQMLTYVTPFGTLQLKTHPLLSESATFTSSGFVLDTKNLVYRYLTGSDTMYKENAQTPGDDALKNEFLTECGLELQFEQTHGYAYGMTTFVP